MSSFAVRGNLWLCSLAVTLLATGLNAQNVVPLTVPLLPVPLSVRPSHLLTSSHPHLRPHQLSVHEITQQGLAIARAKKQGLQKVGKDTSLKKRNSIEAISPRRIFDFITDPSLIITILHSLEVAYWSFPMGFLLMPVSQLFNTVMGE